MGDTQLSHFLAKILRHEAIDRGLQVSEDGYVDVEDILELSEARGRTEEDVRRIVRNDSKGRFSLRDNPFLQIKATQGHSFKIPKPELTLVTHHTQVRCALHGTRSRNWESIKSQGISKMKRTHIHFAQGDRGVKSGFPPNCDMAIEIDVEKAMGDGIRFYISENDVVLTEGRNGVISKKYFRKAYRLGSIITDAIWAPIRA
ncbi:tRNA 2'-phosphotransferase 1-like isoform X1 [Saccostrea echinata]|uniref:tRNA 2'-phosphotransferase 1-like isoform X1 n=1 Tax=Saccostrea echinata TaxID=191078 RepID=UPI002A8224D1|nr:tRNA 2'-phosphotransferase 1-like isoform X1 [Saccostrea echinata]